MQSHADIILTINLPSESAERYRDHEGFATGSNQAMLDTVFALGFKSYQLRVQDVNGRILAIVTKSGSTPRVWGPDDVEPEPENKAVIGDGDGDGDG